MTMNMPAHFTEELDKVVSGRFKEVVSETHDQIPTMIPEVAHVEQLRGVGEDLPLWREKVVRLEDYMLEDREIGDRPEEGAEMEARIHYVKTRMASKTWSYPRQVLMARGIDWATSDILANAKGFGEQLALKKERDVARIYNKGGHLAGHAIFSQALPGLAAGLTTGLLYDGKPLFALSGNNHPNWLGSNTYYNATANSLSAANLTTAKVLVNKTNAKDELDREFAQRANAVLVPPNLEDSLLQIINAQQYAGSGNWGGNPHAGLEPIVWNLLDDTDAWFVLARTDSGAGGRGPRGITFYDDPNGVETFWQHNISTDSIEVMANVYYGLYVDDWRAVQSNALATS